MSSLSPAYKLWMETNGEYVFGPGVFGILVGINNTGTLKEAAKELGMSYRYAWGLIKKAEEALGEPLIHARKGGRLGGGSTELTETGLRLIKEFEDLQTQFSDFIHRFHSVEQTTENIVTGILENITEKEGIFQITLKINQDQAMLLEIPQIEIENMDIGKSISVKLATKVVNIDDS